MKKILILMIAFFTTSLGWSNVPSLSSALNAASSAERAMVNNSAQSFEGEAGQVLAFNESSIQSALEEGFISGHDAAHLSEALTLARTNAEFFDFDIAATIAEMLADNVEGFSPEIAAQTLRLFHSLSPADKLIVGQESFRFDDTSAGYSQLSEQGKRIVDQVPTF